MKKLPRGRGSRAAPVSKRLVGHACSRGKAAGVEHVLLDRAFREHPHAEPPALLRDALIRNQDRAVTGVQSPPADPAGGAAHPARSYGERSPPPGALPSPSAPPAAVVLKHPAPRRDDGPRSHEKPRAAVA